MEQPQAAGIPEKALHFSFPPCSAFPVPDTLWAWAPPLPPSLSFLSQMWLGVVEMPERHLGIVLGLALLGFGKWQMTGFAMLG